MRRGSLYGQSILELGYGTYIYAPRVLSGTTTIQLSMVNDAVCLMMQLQYNQQLRLKLLKEGVMK